MPPRPYLPMPRVVEYLNANIKTAWDVTSYVSKKNQEIGRGLL